MGTALQFLLLVHWDTYTTTTEKKNNEKDFKIIKNKKLKPIMLGMLPLSDTMDTVHFLFTFHAWNNGSPFSHTLMTLEIFSFGLIKARVRIIVSEKNDDQIE